MRRQWFRGTALRVIVACLGLGLLGGCAANSVGEPGRQAGVNAACQTQDHAAADGVTLCGQQHFGQTGGEPAEPSGDPAGRAAIDGSDRSEGGAGEQVRTETGVSLKQSGGTFLVPVTINNTVEIPFIVDSGASDVSIPADVVTVLMRTGTISDRDFLGKRMSKLADGSTVPSPIFRIRSVRVGDRVLENVTGSVALGSGGLLLGQSFLSRFRSWSIDNERKVLVLD
jgi:gag-polyprotein putative aspartyl protease